MHCSRECASHLPGHPGGESAPPGEEWGALQQGVCLAPPRAPSSCRAGPDGCRPAPDGWEEAEQQKFEGVNDCWRMAQGPVE